MTFREGTLLNPLNAELNPIRHLLALVGARHIVHVSRIRVNCGNITKYSVSKTQFLLYDVSGARDIPFYKECFPRRRGLELHQMLNFLKLM